MTSSPVPALLHPESSLDPSRFDYRERVRDVLCSLALAIHPDDNGSESHIQLATRSVDALMEVAQWANDGDSADPTACAWLSYLRWAQAAGATLPSHAPRPPHRTFDDNYAVLSRGTRSADDSFDVLATGHFGEVARPINAQAASPEVLTRSIAYGLVPHLNWTSLVPLAIDSAAITHGHPEAQTAAATTALAVHASLRAREVGAPFPMVLQAVAEVTSSLTRPAPRTRALVVMTADEAQRRDLRHWDSPLSQALRDEKDAASAMALGLAAAGLAHDTEAGHLTAPQRLQFALECAAGQGSHHSAARAVAAAVVTARWGDTDVGCASPRLVYELTTLAAEWNRHWVTSTHSAGFRGP